MNGRILIILGLIGIFGALPIVAQSSGADLDAILASIDEFGTFQDNDFTADYTIVSEKPGEERSIFEARIFRRDSEDKFLLIIAEPALRRGEGYLQVGDTGWSYDPESREFAIFQLRDTFQDSDAQNSDFAGTRLQDNYAVASFEEGRLGSFEVYILTLEATNDTVAYPSTKIWVRQDNYLILKQEDYSLSDRLMRTVLIPTYARAGAYFVPTKTLIIDNLNQGERTEVTVRNISFAAIPDTVFNRSYLERVNR
ncbi:MAG: outer membrane lipoprotein-sorting protein [Spirochaetales bacterium]|nr:outer membrane lipoprotein-sorting protein [Spirochaetales bacterium]